MNYETVARVADDLRKADPSGRNPSVRKVYARAGGDYNQVAEHMRTWRAQQPLGPAAAPPELTLNLLKALRDEIAHHRGAAASDQARELEECREELEDLRREYALSLAGKRELEQQVALVAAERERLAASTCRWRSRSCRNSWRRSGRRPRARGSTWPRPGSRPPAMPNW
jgi:monoamine oxidase